MRKIERLLLCACEGSQAIDEATAVGATGAAKVVRAERLCTDEIDRAAAALAGEGTTLVACGQMGGLFEDLCAEIAAPGTLLTVDIRDRAGWTSSGSPAAKQAALLAEARLIAPATPTKDVAPEGTVLVLADAETGTEAAVSLAEAGLAATLLLSGDPGDIAPTNAHDIALGALRSARGALGRFEVTVDGHRAAKPGGRGPAGFGRPKDAARADCDIILDLRGAAPLFPADQKREGYVRADPGDAAAVARAVSRAAAYQGVFEKPLYVRFEASLCAHSRAGQTGCTRCLDVCPTGAILPAGDTVSIDPDICAGCGACAAVLLPRVREATIDPRGNSMFPAPGAPPRLLAYTPPPAQRLRRQPRHCSTAVATAEMIRLSPRFVCGTSREFIPRWKCPTAETVRSCRTSCRPRAWALSPRVGGISFSPKSGPVRALRPLSRLLERIASAPGRGRGGGAGSRRADQPCSRAPPRRLADASRVLPASAACTTPYPAPPPLRGRRESPRIRQRSALAGGRPRSIPLPVGARLIGCHLHRFRSLHASVSACVSLCPVVALGDSPINAAG